MTCDDIPIAVTTRRAVSPGAERNIGHVFEIPDGGSVELIDYAGTDESVVLRARASTGGASENTALIRWLLRQDPPHWSPFARVRLVLRLRMPIALARQWMRTSAGDYGELSRRYCPPSKVAPTAAQTGIAPIDVAIDAGLDDYERYGQDHRSELARYCAPLGMMTQLEQGIDLRSALWMCVLRGPAHQPWRTAHAQPEILPYATALEEIIRDGWPATYAAWVEYHRDACRLSATEMSEVRRVMQECPDAITRLRECGGSEREVTERLERFGV
jgi:thymidylate synthase ThyX